MYGQQMPIDASVYVSTLDFHCSYVWYVNKHCIYGWKIQNVTNITYPVYMVYVNKHSVDEVTNITYPVVTHRSENIILVHCLANAQ